MTMGAPPPSPCPPASPPDRPSSTATIPSGVFGPGLILLALLFPGLLLPAPARAQDPRSPAADSLPPGVQRIVGSLIDDESLVPIEGAVITALRMEGPDDEGEGTPAGRATTNNAGGFRIGLDRAGYYRLQAQALGYAPTTSQTVRVEDGQLLTVDFRILPEAILMQPLLVTARRGSGEELFYKRMDEWGRGVFMTPDMIDSIAPEVHPAEVFRNRDDTWLSWLGVTRFGAPIPRLKSFKGAGCLGIMVNRIPVVLHPGDVGGIWENYPLDMLRPEDLVAVEYYRYVGEAPPELRRFAKPPGLTAAAQCGLVVFWTEAGW
jgi:hypothetical protein